MDGKYTLADRLWAVSDLLRGTYTSAKCGTVILSFIALRQADCLHAPSVTSPGVLESLLASTAGDDKKLAEDLSQFAKRLPSNVADTLEGLDFEQVVQRLARAGLLGGVVAEFATLDLRAEAVPAQHMNFLHEGLTRRFVDASPEVRSHHSTPPEVAQLVARLLVVPDDAKKERTTTVRVYDPCCGTGGLLASTEARVRQIGTPSGVSVHGQEVHAEACAEARAWQLLKGAEPNAIRHGDVLVDDLHHGETFDYLTAAPPLGFSWAHQRERVESEADRNEDGRFGAGLPRQSDASLLFLQHVVAHMRPAEEGGARAALLLSTASLATGGPGSGESSIRKWLLDRDLLEGVISLPEGLWHNHSMPMYIWLLSNRKPAHLRGKFVAVDAYGEVAKSRGTVGPRLAPDNIDQIVKRYSIGCSTAGEGGRAVLFETAECFYRDIVVERPLRQRFEVSDSSLAAVAKSKVLQKEADPGLIIEALRGLIGTSWPNWPAFVGALERKGQSVEFNRLLIKVIRGAVAVDDQNGEMQKDAHGAYLPDLNLRHVVRVHGNQDVAEFIQKEVLPEFPDAWFDQRSVRIGWALPLAPFLSGGSESGFGPLSSVAWHVPTRAGIRPGPDLPLLRSMDLNVATTASDLTVGDGTGSPLSACTGGDVVGQGRLWRVLPDGFGDALTPLTVLRPFGGAGLALCEWLRTGANRHENQRSRLSSHALVPVRLITDPSFQEVLRELQFGRDAFARIPPILPNVFQDPLAPFSEIRRGARTAASEARVLEDLARPMSDPVWRAEMTYPYSVAVLCRQYRVATSLAQRKEALLKLGEALTRCIGVLALRIQIERKGMFSRKMRERFAKGGGATFGTWDDQIKALVGDGDVPELPEMDARDLVGDGLPLSELRELRNRSGHASRVQPEHELKREVMALKSLVVTALESAGWLSGIHWDVVDLCAYKEQGDFVLSGRRLRGSHPDWEPFERPHQGPVEPHRLYVRSLTSPEALDLWQVARVELCTDCDARELFLLHRVDESNKQMVLRCGRDHELVRALN